MPSHKFASSVDRVVFFSITATIVVFLFIARLVFVQGMQGEEYKKQAEGQYVPAVTPIFNRGNIFLKSKTGEEYDQCHLKGTLKI